MPETQITNEEVCPMVKLTYVRENEFGHVFAARCDCRDCPTRKNGESYICLVPAHDTGAMTIIRSNE